MARSFSQEPRSDSHKIGETRYRMSHLPSTTAIARIVLLAGILLAVTLLASRSFFPAFAQEMIMEPAEFEREFPENSDETVVSYSAMDPEGEMVEWDLVEVVGNSPDHAEFMINQQGDLKFKNPPNFEMPTSSTFNANDGLEEVDNTYKVQIVASDPKDNKNTITVTVKVTNQDEPGTIELSHPQPKEGSTLSATLDDPDMLPTGAGSDDTFNTHASTTWQWFKSIDKSDWTKIEMATSSSYMPVKEDATYYLRATAMYRDRHDSEKTRTAHGISTNTVLEREYINTPPVFKDSEGNATTTFTMEVEENESLLEGADVGAAVTFEDFGPIVGSRRTQENLTYELTGSDASLFTVDDSNGQIMLGEIGANHPLDFEHPSNTDDEYEVVVTATDPSSKSGSVTVTIQLTPVDEPPSITSGSAKPEFLEGTATTIAVATYQATDDEDNNSDLEWSLSDTHAYLFDIEDTGASSDLTFLSSPNYEALARGASNHHYRVKVNVTDSDGLTTSRDVMVKINNRDEAGSVTLSHIQPKAGITITAELEDLDGSIGSKDWQWKLGGDPIPGEESSSYTPKPEDVGSGLTAEVSYTDGHGASKSAESAPARTVVATTTRHAQNDDPDFTGLDEDNNRNGIQVTRTVLENVEIDENVDAAVTATDPNNDQMIYRLTGGATSVFAIGRESGQLTTRVVLDYEKTRSYTVTVEAKDSSLLTKTVQVTISVEDHREDPVIAEEQTAIPYPEIKGSGPNTDPVFTYTATDDEDNNANLMWSVSNETDFEINASGASGVLRFSTTPKDFETLGNNITFTTTVTVTDSDSQMDNRPVTVTVTNVDEEGTVTFDTRQPKEDTELTASVTDPDDISTPAAGIEWQWAKSRSKRNWTDIENATSSTYKPVAADRGHYLQATATYDDGFDEDRTTPGVTENTVAENEYINSPPVFPDHATSTPDTSEITIMVDENDAGMEGDVIARVQAEDAGQSGMETLRYELLDSADMSRFTIGSSTGDIKLGEDTKLDYENPVDVGGTSNEYVLEVKAIDPSLASSTASVMIVVNNVREAPEYDAENKAADPPVNLAATSTVENTATSTTLSAYSATDDEDGTDPVLKWDLEGDDKERFVLCDDESGQEECRALSATDDDNSVHLRLKATLDFETPSDSDKDNVYEVTLVAKDSNDMTTKHDVVVTVTNQQEDGKVTLTNLRPLVGTAITAELEDVDGGESGINWQWFWAESGTGQPRQDEDPADATGWNLVRGGTAKTYTPVSDDEGKILLAYATYNDNATPQDDTDTTDIDESMTMANGVSSYTVKAEKDNANQPPALPDSVQTLEIREDREDTDADVEVGKVIATDGDDQVLTYTLSGPDLSLFEITSVVLPGGNQDPQSTEGRINLLEGTDLDFETRKTYSVTVTATDPSLDSDSVSVTIMVTDFNEAPSVEKVEQLRVSGDTSPTFDENRTGNVATYTATVPDGGTPSWSVSGPDRSHFSIAGGVLSVPNALDYEAQSDANRDNVYEVTVMATAGGMSRGLDVEVTLVNVDEPGTVMISPDQPPYRVGDVLSASLSEGDDETVTGWQWMRSTTPSGGSFTAIGDATNDTYTIVEADVDRLLQVIVTYDDPLGTGKRLPAQTTAAVAGVSTEPNGEVTLSPTDPAAWGIELTANLSDADGVTANTVTWQWARASSASGNFVVISGATGASYTPGDDDVDQYLRATATYTDAVQGAGQEASAVTDSAVLISSYDADADGVIDPPEILQAVRDYFDDELSSQRILRLVRLYFRS